jgi:hypothetical protein
VRARPDDKAEANYRLAIEHPRQCRVALALLFGLYSLIYGVSGIVTGIELRHSGKNLQSIVPGAA